jgi:hypothetical protein
MLVAAIDRNRASADDKFVSSVLSSLKSTPVAKNEEPSNFRRQFPRGEDRRHGDRRNRPSESATPSFQAGESDYVVSLSDSAKKIFREYGSSGILN